MRLLITLITALTLSGTLMAKPAGYDNEIQAFGREMAQKYNFDQEWLDALLSNSRYRQDIIDAISRPAEGKDWHQYHPIFVTDSRATEGIAFWKKNSELLSRAEQTYGVPAEIIVAIIGVETRYGRHAGKYPVVDALSTLAFGYPKRSSFFRKELEHFLQLTREEQVDAAEAKGSYAGAMGMGQFISSSYRAYAVDFDGDGKRDLWQTADAIGSVANYFKRHGWQKGEAVTLPASAESENVGALAKKLKPSHPMSRLSAAGIKPSSPIDGQTQVSLIQLKNKQSHEYWIGLNNFYVITRYNHSPLYAMAVYQLSQKIKAQHKEGT